MMSKEEMQKQLMDAIAKGICQPTTVIMGDNVGKKIIVEAGGIGEQNNYYNSDGKLVVQKNKEVDCDEESDDDPDLEEAQQDKAEELRTNTKLRQEKLKDSYAALLKTKDEFNEGSDWFYIYRMMADMTTYTHPDYQTFIEDLDAAGIDTKGIHKSAFTEMNDRIKDNTTYPNWKVKEGKQQGVLDKGIEYARVAFHIIYK